eukprot:gene48855-65507_t
MPKHGSDFAAGAICAGNRACRSAGREALADLSNEVCLAIPEGMKSAFSALLVLLLAALGTPASAQSYEEQMRQAAGAYERKDMTTAVRIWKVWAAKGEAEAQTLLGAMYWSGDGVPRNLNEAARLYLAAARQGYARAQNNIGFMLGFGEGIPPRDDIEAYKWIKLSIVRYT